MSAENWRRKSNGKVKTICVEICKAAKIEWIRVDIFQLRVLSFLLTWILNKNNIFYSILLPHCILHIDIFVQSIIPEKAKEREMEQTWKHNRIIHVWKFISWISLKSRVFPSTRKSCDSPLKFDRMFCVWQCVTLRGSRRTHFPIRTIHIHGFTAHSPPLSIYLINYVELIPVHNGSETTCWILMNFWEASLWRQRQHHRWHFRRNYVVCAWFIMYAERWSDAMSFLRW